MLLRDTNWQSLPIFTRSVTFEYCKTFKRRGPPKLSCRIVLRAVISFSVSTTQRKSNRKDILKNKFSRISMISFRWKQWLCTEGTLNRSRTRPHFYEKIHCQVLDDITIMFPSSERTMAMWLGVGRDMRCMSQAHGASKKGMCAKKLLAVFWHVLR